MRPHEEGRNAAIDRRTFLKWMPRKIFAGVQELIGEQASRNCHGVHSETSAHSRCVAVITVPQCLAWGASFCQACYLRCPLRDEAIVLDGGKPRIVPLACDGCGVCVEACHAVNDLGAIHIRNI